MFKTCLQRTLFFMLILVPLLSAAHKLDPNPVARTQYADKEYALEWKRYLSGKHLVFRDAYGGDKSRKDYYLCSNGRLKKSSGMSKFLADESITVYGSSRQRSSGRWEVEAFNGRAYLVFIFSDGAINKHLLDNRNGKLFLGGRPYFVADNDKCK